MRRLSRAALTAALTATSFSLLAPGAATAGTTICRTATYDSTSRTICLDLNEQGASVEPMVTISCSDCFPITTGIWRTGFVPADDFTPPTVDPATGSVRSEGGFVGTLWIDGKEFPLRLAPFCVGDPGFCA